MSGIKVDFGSLADGQGAINGVYRQLVATLEQLEADLQPMVSSWTGTAQASYAQCKRNWDQAAEQLALLLNNIGSAVGTANENYQAAERAAKANWA